MLLKRRYFICLSFLFLGACQHQEITNSPCASQSAPIQIKASANLSNMFGNDAIRAAVDAVTQALIKRPGTPTADLTATGVRAVTDTAAGNYKNYTAQDREALEAYLREEVIPTIRHNSPTCNFIIGSASRPYISIERVFMHGTKKQRVPWATLRNTGREPIRCQVELRYILDGTTSAMGVSFLELVPNQYRSIYLPKADLPTSKIENGKARLTFKIEFSYLMEGQNDWTTHEEAWEYDHSIKDFYMALNK